MRRTPTLGAVPFDAVEKAPQGASLKVTTRNSYNVWLDKLLVPRFGERALADVTGKELAGGGRFIRDAQSGTAQNDVFVGASL